jgi:hypothetical protein
MSPTAESDTVCQAGVPYSKATEIKANRGGQRYADFLSKTETYTVNIYLITDSQTHEVHTQAIQ